MKLVSRLSLVSCSLLALSTMAAETPIGDNVEKNGMEIAAVYLQPISMEHSPKFHHLTAEESDIHLEADIHAIRDNPNGFAEGDWMPYLVVNYKLSREGGASQEGRMMPMVANDGPHYGENLKLDGPGKYKLVYEILPPSMNETADFGRHTDKETGVGEWFEPFTVEWEFSWAGTGKKGGY